MMDTKQDEQRPVISTVVLNWNRADLLKITLDSLAKTTKNIPHEIFIVDNASGDGSREVIEEFCAHAPHASAIMLEKNIGGDAINLGLEKCRGDYLHITENDMQYLPGWAEEVVGTFEAFEELGQLSPFGPSPEDDELLEVRGGSIMYRKGRIIYKAEDNSGTTCILRRQVYDAGVRVRTFGKEGVFLFPDDGMLSIDVRKKGYIVAWAEHYIVKNLGHTLEEFRQREDYYRENYKAKYWFKESRWKERISSWQERTELKRQSFLMPGARLMADMSKPGGDCPEPYLWSMLDGRTPPAETLEFMYSLVRMAKPLSILETGAWLGVLTEACARALRDNGRGGIVSWASDTDTYDAALKRLEGKGLEAHMELLSEPPVDVGGDDVDMLILDLYDGGDADALPRLLRRLADGGIAVLLNGRRAGQDARQAMENAASSQGYFMFPMPTPRGFTLMRKGVAAASAHREAAGTLYRRIYYRWLHFWHKDLRRYLEPILGRKK